MRVIFLLTIVGASVAVIATIAGVFGSLLLADTIIGAINNLELAWSDCDPFSAGALSVIFIIAAIFMALGDIGSSILHWLIPFPESDTITQC